MNIFRLTVIKFCIVFFIPLKVYSQSTEIYTDLRGGINMRQSMIKEW